MPLQDANPTPSFGGFGLKDGDCVNSTLPEGISIDTVVIVPCSGDWQYRVLKSFQVADAEPYPGESFFLSQVSENCDRQTSFLLSPSAQSWEQGDRTINCLQQAPELVISALLEGLEVNEEALSDDEASCLEEWVAGANLLAFVATSEDPAVIDDFIAQLERCAPNLLGFTIATGTPAMTPTPEPTATPTTAPTATPTDTPTPEPTATPTTAPTHMPTPEPTAIPSRAPTATPTNTPTPEPPATPTTESAADRAALVALYEATDGPNWTNNAKWLSEAPLGEWYGITTDSIGRVIELDLQENELSGEIPPQLGSLSNLRVLNLSENNRLSGAIPSELGNLSRLETLDLSDQTGQPIIVTR